ncbi:unnamed protein product [Calicophoron daubneyi]|uniref:EKC/KEOPS complex subunit CGI121 n=1 Tax=Calicophoron daubneyi TaxID=300641 RepID=A0AAV2TPH5_CALDB
MWRTVHLDLFPEYGARVGLWERISNAEELHKQITGKGLTLAQSMSCTWLSATYIIDVVQVEAAVTQALLHMASGRMATKELATEVIYCLSPKRSFSRALADFGLTPSTKRLLVVVTYPKNLFLDSSERTLDSYLDEIEHLVQGVTSHGDMSCLDDGIKLTSEFYGITALEQALIDQSADSKQALVDSIITRMSAREVCRS